MRLTILSAAILAANVAVTAINWNPAAADAKVEASHPMFADPGFAVREMQVFDTIKARQIMLVDEKGYPAIHLIAGRSTSGIWVSDSKQTAAIYTDKYQGPVFALIDNRDFSKGAPLAFSLGDDGKPVVQIVDGKSNIFDAVKIVPKD